VKNVRCIHEEELNWSEFERLFKKKYLLERYLDDRAKEFYELKMGSMTNEEYTSCYRHFWALQPQSNMSINQGILSP